MLNETLPSHTIVPYTGMGLYLHVPFCKTKCPYCDFNTYQGIETLWKPYVEALTTELGLWGRVLRRPKANTVFLGGGTPSYLPDGYVGRMIAAARVAFDLAPDAEVTAEANPDDLDPRACRKLLSQGVNRLSIGVQSLDDGLLVLLGRRHGASDALAAYRSARSAGFTNISLDLMYGLPQQTMAQWLQTVRGVLSLSPDHVSAYCLTLEEGTPLHHWVQEGKLPRPDDDLAADMYDWAAGALAEAGYQQYEISNWALPGFRARHNLGYWLNQPYLGVGPGAHSRLGSYRFWEVDSPRAYISQVKRWEAANPASFLGFAEAELRTITPVAGQEFIDLDTACAETMILGLRLLDGMDLTEASALAGADLAQRYHPQLNDLVGLGLLEQVNGRVRLAKSAYLIANQVFTRFVS